MKKSTFKNYIENFDFQELFVDLGWNYVNRDPHPVRIGDTMFQLKPVSEKEGFHILLCSPDEQGTIPDYATRKKLETRVTRLYREHLIIFTDKAQSEQLWQWMVRKPNQPARLSGTRWRKEQAPELLYQKASGLFFSLDEEDNITIVDVKERVAENFDKNNEKVTKKFYGDFKKQHRRFLKFIEGIEKHADRDWYASLMLNRLMFCYFIQKKGFLDGDLDYLQNKLKACQEKKGENEFYNFYRDFLLALFHEGLGTPVKSPSTEIELGNIPYLNGGLFEEHDLEQSYDIHIEDEAFERIFNFFDQYEWYLDTRHGATGKEINPDVIGYIFEKYINDRADMGAYYTKEDITDYISKNCVLPYLFDETERHYSEVFKPEGWIWQMLKVSGDTYIYNAVKHGIPRDKATGDILNWKYTEHWWESPVFDDLPEVMKAGLNPNQEKLVEIREVWNTPAPEEVALPTEIWREVIERRKRYLEVRQKTDNGKISRINDLITYNLNIRQFVQDVVVNTGDPKFILHFYKSMAGDGQNRHPVSILDPTCGSGAFLFAALNILEPLYESCLQRMRSFVEDEDRLNAKDKQTFRHKYKFFREVLEDVQSDYHPNEEYFIYKSIILRNLYGVDIMREAVEIAKLRLFLKMVATVEVDTSKENLGLEPLPDIDFNIRAGNTLVGIGTEEEIDTLYDGFMDFDNTKEAVEEQCDMVAKAFAHYKQIQLTYGEDFESFKQAKADLAERLTDLRDKLDEMLKKRHYPGKNLQEWKESHQPFHWYAEFYDVIHDRGGFDVIIGNPPYVEYSRIKKLYKTFGFKTESCGNIYAFVIERSLDILSKNGIISMIVQLPLVCTDRMNTAQEILLNDKRNLYSATFDDRPGKLFDGLQHIRASIFTLAGKTEDFKVLTTKYNRWYTEQRPFLFENLYYQGNDISYDNSIPKVGDDISTEIFRKISEQPTISSNSKRNGKYNVYYHNAPQYWVRGTTFVPYFWNERDGNKISSHVKSILFNIDKESKVICSAIDSSVFYLWFILLSNCRDLGKREIDNFGIPINAFRCDTLEKLNEKLMDDLKKNKYRKETSYKTTGRVVYDEYYPKLSKDIVDEIDIALSKYYGFTEEELDYIINYDIKYRMGSELEDYVEAEAEAKAVITQKEKAMLPFGLDTGIYTVTDAMNVINSVLEKESAKVSYDKVRRWFKDLADINYQGLKNSIKDNIDNLRISFHGLIELYVIGVLQEKGFRLNKIMTARENLANKTNKQYPFATNNVRDNLKVHGRSIEFNFPNVPLVTLNGTSQFNLDLINEFFRDIEFDTDGIARQIIPKKGNKEIIIDPQFCGGKPALKTAKVEVETIQVFLESGESKETIMAEYDLTESAIEGLLKFTN